MRDTLVDRPFFFYCCCCFWESCRIDWERRLKGGSLDLKSSLNESKPVAAGLESIRRFRPWERLVNRMSIVGQSLDLDVKQILILITLC
jgi:hypothetical protein